jgi:hypothetical protein
MKKVVQSRAFLLAVLFVLIASAFSFIAYSKSKAAVCSSAGGCCLKTEPAGSSEMIWDALSRQFISAVHF